jgi:hypothetical protein
VPEERGKKVMTAESPKFEVHNMRSFFAEPSGYSLSVLAVLW